MYTFQVTSKELFSFLSNAHIHLCSCQNLSCQVFMTKLVKNRPCSYLLLGPTEFLRGHTWELKRSLLDPLAFLYQL